MRWSRSSPCTPMIARGAVRFESRPPATWEGNGADERVVADRCTQPASVSVEPLPKD
jgi:hypothetical protein